jgi:hypothetical protein
MTPLRLCATKIYAQRLVCCAIKIFHIFLQFHPVNFVSVVEFSKSRARIQATSSARMKRNNAVHHALGASSSCAST